MTAAVLLNLAERCETEGPSRDLDLDIACAAMGFENASKKPGYWMVRPAGRAWWSTDLREIEPFTFAFDAARSISNWVLLQASDIGADGLPLVVLGDPSTPPAREVKGIAGRTLALTLCAAALRARADEIARAG